MAECFDVAVVGGGPAGLAAATATSRVGLATVLFERSSGPPDKACGEGLMPAGVRALEALGARAYLGAGDCSRFLGIRYVQEDGSAAVGRLPAEGLGIRRTALTEALARRAGECGVELRWDCPVDGFTSGDKDVTLRTGAGPMTARVVVAADGLHSRLRRLAGLDSPTTARPRLGLRQHFSIAPWSEFVEVHLSEGMEAFVTPAGAARVGIAFLWEREAFKGAVSIEAFMARFPAVAARLRSAPADSRPRGAGPLAQRARSCTGDRLVLIGDAAGYVDAITGEGLSLAFTCAAALGTMLPDALSRGASRAALDPYARFYAGEFRRYATVCGFMLALSRRPPVRRRVVRFLGRHPRLFDRLIAHALA